MAAECATCHDQAQKLAKSAHAPVACATCHDPSRGWSNGKAIALGTGGQAGVRNAPSLVNTTYHTFLFWDGRAGSLEEQALVPILNPVEMGKASGVFNMGRFLGGMFGVALLVAVFSGTGTIGSTAGFSTGFASAMLVAALLSLLGALAGIFLPARRQVATAPTPQNA